MPSCSSCLEDLCSVILTNELLKDKTSLYRALPEGKEKTEFKLTRFPFASFSGIFTKRNNKSLHNYSSLMVLDLDDLEDVENARKQLISQRDIHIAMMYTSPSGNGLKVVVPSTTPEEHKQVFEMYELYFIDQLGLTVDSSGRDIARACFICHDPQLYSNSNYQFKKLDEYWNLPVPEPTLPTLKSINSKQGLNFMAGVDISPIRDFNLVGEIQPILLKHGWTIHNKLINKVHYTRPGKNPFEGPSGNVLFPNNYFWVFSNASSFEAGRGYTPSEVFAVLECGSDITLANEELRAMGFGYQDEDLEEGKKD